MTETFNPDRISKNPGSTWQVKPETQLALSKNFFARGDTDEYFRDLIVALKEPPAPIFFPVSDNYLYINYKVSSPARPNFAVLH